MQFTPHLLQILCVGNTLINLQFTPHVFDRFNKLSRRSKRISLDEKQREHKSLISTLKNAFNIAFALYLAFIFCKFSVYP